VIDAAFAVLMVAGACFGYRMLAGPTMADRVVGLNGFVLVFMSAIAVQAVDTRQGSFLFVLVVLAVVGFLGTAMVARYIESRGS
jgi:multisubunit Na+/H+ antiporter MnhF subunit